MSDISLLPEGLRGNEPVQKQKTAPSAEPPGLKMHVPSSTADEDIEIIEVDESDLGAILADEPLFTRLSYQLSATLDSLKQKLFSDKNAAPPPKLPPQFFTPPKPGLVTRPPASAPPVSAPGLARPGATPAAPGASAHPRARITPSSEMPRRVRVIRRIRKPVRITLLSPEEMQAYRADIPRRKWTLVVCATLFTVIIGGGYWLLTARIADAQAKMNDLNAQQMQTKSEITQKEQEWEQYRDLQTRLIALNDLLNHHIITSRVFDFLERWTVPDVSYQDAAWTPDGTLSLSVSASSYAAAARQIVAFQRSSIVQRVSALSFSQSGASDDAGAQAQGGAKPPGGAAQSTTVSFQLLLKLDASAFHGPALAPGLTPSASSTSSDASSVPPAPAS